MAFSGWAQKSTRSLEQADPDTNLGGYRTDITEDQLRRSGVLSQPRLDWNDRPARVPQISAGFHFSAVSGRTGTRQLQRR